MTETTTISANDLLWVWLDPSGANVTRKIKASNLLKTNHPCEVVFGDPNSTASTLADGDDQPQACGNVSGHDATISAVACYADAGSPTVTPILSGRAANSIVSAAITCNGGTWVAGTINGTPTLKTFDTDGATCTDPGPCTVDANLTSVTSSGARYIIIRFTTVW